MPHYLLFYRFRAIFACLAALGLVLPISSCARADGKPAHNIVVQTFEPARNNGMPLVQVRFSNTLIGTFAVDTGEYESVITEDFVKKANLNPSAYEKRWLGFGLFPVTVVEVPQIRLENLEMLKPTFRVVSQDFLFPMGGRQIDGILGGDVLSRFALRIDYPAHEIDWITPGNLSDKDVVALGFTLQNFIELGQERDPGSDEKVNHYSLRAKFQSGDAASAEDLWIDTGSPATSVSYKLAGKLNLSPSRTELHEILSGSPTLLNRSSVAKMQIGQMALSDVSVVAPQQKDTGFPLLLGENVLSDCVVLLDFGPHRFYLKPVLPPAKDDSATPLDKKQIIWDRLRAAPDLPTVEEMLAGGFAPDAQDSLAERVAHLQTPDTNSAKDTNKEIARLDKLGAWLRLGQDSAGADAAFAQAVTLAKAAAQAHPEDGAAARQWVEALNLAERHGEAVAAATETTAHLPRYAPGWRLLSSVLIVRAASVLVGDQKSVTESIIGKTSSQTSPLTSGQAATVEALLAQAHTALDTAIALAPDDAESYRSRALYQIVSLIALGAIRQNGIKIDLPASKTFTGELSLALAIADWQQWAALSQKNVEALTIIADLDRRIPFFHDRDWLTAHLKGTSRTLPPALTTVDTVKTCLTPLTQSQDKALAASAWTALGTVQAGSSDAGGITGAESSWRQALALEPAQSEALTALAAHLKRDGQWTELRDLLTQQTARHDTVPTRLTLACVLSGEGLPADAEAQARAANALAPDNASVNLVLADLLLARSSGDPATLSEAATCLAKARTGYGTLATPEQEATLTTSESVWLALDHDPDAAEKQIVALARKQPNCTQAREALAALIPY